MTDKRRRRRRVEDVEEPPTPLTGTEVDDEDADLDPPDVTAAFEEPPTPLTGS